MIDIKDIQKGKKDTFKQLFESYYLSLCIFCEKYVKDEDTAVDIVQEAFVRLWNKKDEFENLFKIKAYLYKIVKNLSLNEIRNSKIRNNYKELSFLETEEFYRDALIEEESYRIFYSAIETLPSRSKEIILLSLKGLKNNEIAEYLEVSPNTIHTLKKGAYRKLRELLKQHFYLILIFF